MNYQKGGQKNGKLQHTLCTKRQGKTINDPYDELVQVHRATPPCHDSCDESARTPWQSLSHDCAHDGSKIRRGKVPVMTRGSFVLLTVQLFEGFELIDECLVLIFEDGNPVLQALDVFFLFSPALLRGIPVFE